MFLATLCALCEIITYIPDLPLPRSARLSSETSGSTANTSAALTSPLKRCTASSSRVLQALGHTLSQLMTRSEVTQVEDEKMLRESIRWIGVVEKEGLQVLPEYEAHLTTVATASLHLVNSENHAKYMAMVETWRRVILGGSGDVYFLGLFQQSLFRSSESGLHNEFYCSLLLVVMIAVVALCFWPV